MAYQKIKAKDLEVGMYLYWDTNSYHKGFTDKIIKIEYYDSIHKKFPNKIRIYFENGFVGRTHFEQIKEIRVGRKRKKKNWKLAIDDSKLNLYNFYLKPYKKGSVICTCDNIVPIDTECNVCGTFCTTHFRDEHGKFIRL